MMKVDKIIPCICCDHQPTEADSVYYGMPILKVTGGTLSNGKTVNFFEAQCPRCGREGLLQHKSAYLALRKWNEMQERLREKMDETD